MKNLLLIFLLIFSGTVWSQQEITHELESFSEVKVSNGLKLNLIYADENRAVVTGDNRQDVHFDIEEGILKIRTKLDNIWKENNTEIDLYFTYLRSIDAGQNSTLQISRVYKVDKLSFEASEGAKIYAEIDVNQLQIKSLTGGEIELNGKADFQEVKIRAGGQYYARYLESKDINISISAGGVADINASEKVNAKVRAGGTVNVYGDPEIIDKDTLFGGKVNRKN